MKPGGWPWEQTTMTNPCRAERRWVAMARATLWGVSVEWHAEATQAAIIVTMQPATQLARRRASGRRPRRSLRCFQRGGLLCVAALIHGHALRSVQVSPEAWPKRLDPHGARPPTDQAHQKAA